MNPKITKLKAERAKNDEKIAALRSRNRELDESIVELENTDIIGLARATGMSMEELAQFLTQLKRGGAPFITPNTTSTPAISSLRSRRNLSRRSLPKTNKKT